MTVIGYEVTHVWCRACAPEGVTLGGNEVMAGSDHGVPYHCDDCGSVLAPCEHEWSEWRPWYAGGWFRICDKDGCGEVDQRDVSIEYTCPACGKPMPSSDTLCSGSFLDRDHPPNVRPVASGPSGVPRPASASDEERT